MGVILNVQSQCQICVASPHHCNGNQDSAAQGKCQKYVPSKILIEKQQQYKTDVVQVESYAKKTERLLKWIVY